MMYDFKQRYYLIILCVLSASFILKNVSGKSFNKKIACIKVNVLYKSTSKNDTLCLSTIDVFFSGAGKNKLLKTEKKIISSDGYFHFSIPVNKDGYFQVQLANSKDSLFIRQGIYEPLTPVYFYEMGDSLTINIEGRKHHSRFFNLQTMYRYSFSGEGSEKLKLNEQIDSILSNMGSDKEVLGFDSNMVYHSPLSGQRIEAGYNYLNKHKQSISSVAYWVLQAELIYNHGYSVFTTIRDQLYSKSISHTRNGLVDIIELSPKVKKQYFEQLDSAFSVYRIPEFALIRSKNYLRFTFLRIESDCLVKYGTATPQKIFDWIMGNYQGEIRDRLLVYYFVNYYNGSGLNSQLKKAKSVIKTSYCRDELAKITGRINGKPAYNFALSDINGDTIHLSDFKGKIVMLDFWFTGCGGCAVFYHDILSKVEEKFGRDTNVVFISISLDKSERWEKGLMSGIYTSNKAINVFTNDQGMATPIVKHYNVVTCPTFIIIKNGKMVEYNPFLKDDHKLVDIINNLKRG